MNFSAANCIIGIKIEKKFLMLNFCSEFTEFPLHIVISVASKLIVCRMQNKWCSRNISAFSSSVNLNPQKKRTIRCDFSDTPNTLTLAIWHYSCSPCWLHLDHRRQLRNLQYVQVHGKCNENCAIALNVRVKFTTMAYWLHRHRHALFVIWCAKFSAAAATTDSVKVVGLVNREKNELKNCSILRFSTIGRFSDEDYSSAGISNWDEFQLQWTGCSLLICAG